jgi:AcrR family transcriptional regulator
MTNAPAEQSDDRTRNAGGNSLTPKGAGTRARLIAVAERLFARKGIEGVSLNEINRAARQRHSNSCHYHFGGKEGLIQAILDKHIPGIAARRNAKFDAIEATGTLDLKSVIHAWVEPVVAKLSDRDGGKEFIRISAQLMTHHLLATQNLGPSPFTLPEVDRLTRTLTAALAGRDFPDLIVRQKLMMAGIMVFHGLAEYSRLIDAVPELGSPSNRDVFARHLEAMVLGAMTAETVV